MPEQPTFLFAGGGTGGHVYPGLALARELEELVPNARIAWVGTKDRVEARAVPRAGYPLETVDVRFLKGRRGLDLLRAVSRLPGAGMQARAIVKKHSPKVVIGLGGFAAGPVCLAAASMGVPVVLLEQNARPGVTNRALGRVARCVYATFPESKKWFPSGRVKELGNPIRRELVEAVSGREPLKGRVPRILVFGGSQGSTTLNRHMPRIAQAIAAQGIEFELRHASGRGRLAELESGYGSRGVEARLDEYIDDMATAYREADLVVCRAGATTISELTAVGLGALYVPFPHAADDHQTANALSVVEAGGGVMVTDDEFAGDRAVRILSPLLRFPQSLQNLGEASRRLGRPNAAEMIAHDLLRSVHV